MKMYMSWALVNGLLTGNVESENRYTRTFASQSTQWLADSIQECSQYPTIVYASLWASFSDPLGYPMLLFLEQGIRPIGFPCFGWSYVHPEHEIHDHNGRTGHREIGSGRAIQRPVLAHAQPGEGQDGALTEVRLSGNDAGHQMGNWVCQKHL